MPALTSARRFVASHAALLSGLLFFAAFLWLFQAGLNATYPWLGHDLILFVPRLLAGKWHFVRQGLRPFLYDPHFCGGLPVYANPEDMYYSLQQFLVFFLDVWTALQITALAMLMLGYAGWYRAGRDAVGLSRPFAHLLALIVLADGFVFLHVTVGHVTFYTFPLMGWFLWLLFDRRSRVTHLRAAGFGLLAALVLYAGGYIVLWQTAVATLLIMPFDLLRSREPLARVRALAVHMLVYGGAALLACASKLVAILSYMIHFPRTVPFLPFDSSASATLYIIRALWGVPQDMGLFSAVRSPTLMLHELSLFLSPAVLIGLAAGLVLACRHRALLRRNLARVALTCCAVAALGFLFVDLARGYGPIADVLTHLPLFESWRVPQRFLYILVLLLSLGSMPLMQRFVEEGGWSGRSLPIAAALSFITLLAAVAAYRPLLTTERVLAISPSFSLQQYHEALALHAGYLALPVHTVRDDRGTLASDFQVLWDGAASVSCYQQLYQPDGSPASLRAGAADLVSDGTYNLHNPACFIYPRENGCAAPRDRIRVSDRANFEAFTQGRRTTWRSSAVQRVSDAVTILTLISASVILAATMAGKFRARNARSA